MFKLIVHAPLYFFILRSFVLKFADRNSNQDSSLIVKIIFPLRNCKQLNKFWKIG